MVILNLSIVRLTRCNFLTLHKTQLKCNLGVWLGLYRKNGAFQRAYECEVKFGEI